MDWEEQEDDEFPQQEEVEAVLREKEQREQQREQRERQREQKEQKEQQREPKEQQREQKVKSPFIKPTIILNKVLSEGNMGLMEAKKEDASIEVKLHEQELPPTSQQRQAIRSDSVAARLEEACPLSLADRIRIEKENYEKCSRLIDGTIIDLLEAHRGRRVAARR